MNTLLKELCMIKGISGREKSVREYILGEIFPYCECRVDPLGNIIALRKGKKEAKSRVMVAAHMDEVGFMVSYIYENGLLRISPVGGIDPAVIYGKTLKVGKNAITGVAGAKPVHMLDGDEKKKEIKMDDIYVDIGAQNREEAEKLVSLGDSVCFDSDYIHFGDGMIKAPAVDDRAGCAIMIELIKNEPEYDTYFVFTVQEEVGTRGAEAAVFSVKPDKAIIVETTTAADINGVSDEKEFALSARARLFPIWIGALFMTGSCIKPPSALPSKRA